MFLVSSIPENSVISGVGSISITAFTDVCKDIYVVLVRKWLVILDCVRIVSRMSYFMWWHWYSKEEKVEENNQERI